MKQTFLKFQKSLQRHLKESAAKLPDQFVEVNHCMILTYPKFITLMH